MRRAVARKKVLALVVLTILIDTIPYYLLRSSGPTLLPVVDDPYLWVTGIFVPQGFFLPFIALLIAAGSMSEEYEQGTAEVLLSKPVSREEFFFGKFSGGFLLLTIVILLNATLSLTSATLAFGTQLALGVLPLVVVAQIFSSIVFYSVAFMSGELVRRSSLSYVLASAVYFTSEIAGIYLRVIFTLTGNTFYQQINFYLPTTPVSSLPFLVGTPGLPAQALDVLRFVGTGATETSITFSVGLIVAFAVGAVLVAVLHFRWADISKRVA
ncbi:MAG: ABC transporter permease [Thaumarchaeota archaeon]|nr:ABC transporter permease [Nitrososphaerota archaeon]